MSRLNKLDSGLQTNIENARQKAKEDIHYNTKREISQDPFWETFWFFPNLEINGQIYLQGGYHYTASTRKKLLRILDEEFENDRYLVGY